MPSLFPCLLYFSRYNVVQVVELGAPLGLMAHHASSQLQRLHNTRCTSHKPDAISVQLRTICDTAPRIGQVPLLKHEPNEYNASSSNWNNHNLISFAERTEVAGNYGAQ